MANTKKVKSAGRLRAGYGIRVKKRLVEVESKQRIKQKCPFCKGRVKRIAKGIWNCNRCKKRFASNTFYID